MRLRGNKEDSLGFGLLWACLGHIPLDHLDPCCLGLFLKLSPFLSLTQGEALCLRGVCANSRENLSTNLSAPSPLPHLHFICPPLTLCLLQLAICTNLAKGCGAQVKCCCVVVLLQQTSRVCQSELRLLTPGFFATASFTLILTGSRQDISDHVKEISFYRKQLEATSRFSQLGKERCSVFPEKFISGFVFVQNFHVVTNNSANFSEITFSVNLLSLVWMDYFLNNDGEQFCLEHYQCASICSCPSLSSFFISNKPEMIGITSFLLNAALICVF